MARWILLGLSTLCLLGTANLGYAAEQSAADRSAQEPQFISTEVVVDPFDVPPRRDTSHSDNVSTGPDTLDPDGLSPHRQLMPVNES